MQLRYYQILFLILFNTTALAHTPAPSAEALNIDQDTIGLQGPLTFHLQVSTLNGTLLETAFIHALNDTHAFNIIVEAGQREYRFNTTWGMKLAHQQLLKITAEYLQQKLPFYFDSGTLSRWVEQQAYGASYQIALGNQSLLKNITLNTYYAHAQSTHLNALLSEENAMSKINQRHIAGATTQGDSVGFSVHPWHQAALGAELNYDAVHYHRQFELKNAHNTRGFGNTITFEQLLTDTVKMNLLGSHRKTVDDYKVTLAWLIPLFSKEALEIGMDGERVISHNDTPDDNRYGIHVSFSDDLLSKYILSSSNVNIDLTQWIATPAVRMAQVMAAADQYTEEVTNQQQMKHMAVSNTPVFLYTERPQKIEMAAYLPVNQTIKTLQGLPTGLHYEKKSQSLEGKIPATALENASVKIFPVLATLSTLTNTYLNASTKTEENQKPLITLTVRENTTAPYANPNFSPTDYEIAAGESIRLKFIKWKYTAPDTIEKESLFINPIKSAPWIYVNDVSNLPPGLYYEQTKKESAENPDSITLLGTVDLKEIGKTYTVTLSGINYGNKQTTPPQTIRLHIVSMPVFGSFELGEAYADAPYQFDIKSHMAYLPDNSIKINIADNTPLPTWLHLKDGILQGSPPQKNNGPVILRFKTTFKNREIVSDDKTLTLLNISPAPTLISTIPMEYAALHNTMTLPIARYFTVKENAAAIDSYQLEGSLPNGISFDKKTGDFKGEYNSSGQYAVTIKAHNQGGWSEAQSLNFDIYNDQKPEIYADDVPSTIVIQGVEGESIYLEINKYFHLAKYASPIDEYAINPNFDTVSGKIAAQAVNRLPAGIQFDKKKGVLFGTYAKNSRGSYHLIIRVHNRAGWSQFVKLTDFFIKKNINQVTLQCPIESDVLAESVTMKTNTHVSYTFTKTGSIRELNSDGLYLKQASLKKGVYLCQYKNYKENNENAELTLQTHVPSTARFIHGNSDCVTNHVLEPSKTQCIAVWEE